MAGTGILSYTELGSTQIHELEAGAHNSYLNRGRFSFQSWADIVDQVVPWVSGLRGRANSERTRSEQSLYPDTARSRDRFSV